ncbi:MAG TPA: hypothetical protein VNW90_25170 [Acetobacteraceae bacterium]|nr:hypothetical protein [Acetobacteraceae bacterium]
MPEDKPQGPPPPSATDFLLNQAPHSIYRAASSLTHAVIHPIDTAWNAGKLVAGTLRAAARGAGMDMPDNEADQVARHFVDYAKNRWGGVDEIKNALYHDPAGMLMDFSAALSGAGGVLRGAGALSGVEAASTLGRELTTAGEVTNPLYVPSRIASGTINRLITKPPPAPPEPPAFDPKTVTFANEEVPFDPSTGTFHEQPGGYKSPQPPQAKTAAQQLREEWGVKEPGVEASTPPPPPKPKPQPKPAAAPPPPPAPPAAAPPPAGSKLAQNIRTVLQNPLSGGALTYEAINLLTHHLAGSIGGGLVATAAIKYLPQLLKSEAGQQMLARIGPESNAAAVAGVARDLVPALNTLYQSQLKQQSMGERSAFDRAKGGMVNPELARIQRERLHLPGILGMLEHK